MFWCLLVAAWTALALAEPPVPRGQYGAPSSQYGAPGGFGSGGYQGGAGGRTPSSQYGAPGFGGGRGYAGGSGGSGGGYQDPRDKPMFTHEQDFQRPGGEVWGKWTVALPDGRIQRVEYDADETGFHPVITYDEPGTGGTGGVGGVGGVGGGNGGGRNGGQGGYRYR